MAQVRDCLYVADVGRAFALILESDTVASANMVSGLAAPILAIAQETSRILGGRTLDSWRNRRTDAHQSRHHPCKYCTIAEWSWLTPYNVLDRWSETYDRIIPKKVLCTVAKELCR